MKPEDNQENFKKCICMGCPLYNDCNREKKEKLFCARQKSQCSMDNTKRCICGACSVYSENELSGGYFCINAINK